MLPWYRVAEIILYSLLNFLPYIGLALFPFRNRLRFSVQLTVILIALASILQISLGIWAAFFHNNNTGIISILSTVIYFVFYFTAVKANPGKLLFTLLMLSNIANFVVVLSKCVEGQLFPSLASQQYRWSFSVTLLLSQLIILIPLFFYIKGILYETMQKETSRFIWWYLWLIPATFYLIFSYQLYCNSSQSSLEIALKSSNTLFLLCINLGAFLIYYMVTCLINEFDKNIRLEKQNHMLMMSNLQYENLKDKIEEARRARHDLRHHIAVMSGYLNGGEYENLKAYLISLGNSMPEDSSAVFCQNHTVNLLLTYFAQQAADNGTEFNVYADIPSELGISESDLSVLLGNLLENAIDACSSQKSGERRIFFRGREENGALLFTIDNTFDGRLIQEPNGSFLSTKHREPALGLESASHIAARYGGVFRASHRDGMFYASVRLESARRRNLQ